MIANNNLRWSVATHAANAPNEDRTLCNHTVTRDGAWRVFAVFDGHGGTGCAEFCQQALPAWLERAQDHCHRGRTWLRRAYTATDNDWMARGPAGARTGACALTLCIQPDRGVLYVGNAGDCRAVLIATCDDGEDDDNVVHATALSRDHDCHNPSERIRVARRTTDPHPVRRAVGTHHDASMRVAGALSVTRAMGDAFLKRGDQSFGHYQPHVPYIVATPEVRTRILGPADHFVVLASDGVFRWVTNEELADVIVDLERHQAGVTPLAQRFLDWILMHRVAPATGLPLSALLALPTGPARRRLHDDMTVVIVDVQAAVPGRRRGIRRRRSTVSLVDEDVESC